MCLYVVLYLNTIISNVLDELVSYADQKIRMIAERKVGRIICLVGLIKGAKSFVFILNVSILLIKIFPLIRYFTLLK